MVSKEQKAALKRGPMGTIFTQLRYWKRKLRGEPLTGEYEWNLPVLTVEDLLPQASGSLDPARLLYSMGLDYLSKETAAATYRALACLRSAETLRFESPERIRLYAGVAYARLGQAEQARRLVETLLPEELTDKENDFRQLILQGAIVRCEPATQENEAVSAARQIVEAEAPARIFVLGDSGAQSALWLPNSSYFCACKTVNGLEASDVAKMELAFNVGLATEADAQAATTAGARCARWITVRWNDERS